MKKLPPAKQKQLIGVLIFTVALICTVYFLLISPQNDKNQHLAQQISQASGHLKEYKDAILKKQEVTEQLAVWTEQMKHAEEDVASGDLYAWTYDMIRHFKTAYPKLEIPTPGQPSLGDCELIADFPYKQIRFSMTGTSYYHDLGRFVADFENKFPHCQVLDLSVDPAMGGTGQTPTSLGEKLSFRMDIVALVKPNS
ncbi:MAG: hypothetical protein P4M10_07570 [Verrucomicrobiae bacterium]|nr:hypothetical protein [Verrucomicrobiae bacterium]